MALAPTGHPRDSPASLIRGSFRGNVVAAYRKVCGGKELLPWKCPVEAQQMSCAASDVTSQQFLKIPDKSWSLRKALDTVRVRREWDPLC